MRILALETSAELGTCALWLAGETVERACPPGRPHSETLLPLVGALLAEAGCGFGDLDGIAFGAGPGAFTGLRVACGVAQGLAVAAGLPVVPVGTLEALAMGRAAPRVLALLDARMGEVYCAWLEREGEGFKPLYGPALGAPGDLPLPPSGEAWLAAGNALAAYPQLAARARAAGCGLAPEAMPGAAAVARLAAPRLAGGGGIDPAGAVPLYVRDKVARTVAERLAEGGRA